MNLIVMKSCKCKLIKTISNILTRNQSRVLIIDASDKNTIIDCTWLAKEHRYLAIDSFNEITGSIIPEIKDEFNLIIFYTWFKYSDYTQEVKTLINLFGEDKLVFMFNEL